MDATLLRCELFCYRMGQIHMPRIKILLQQAAGITVQPRPPADDHDAELIGHRGTHRAAPEMPLSKLCGRSMRTPSCFFQCMPELDA